MSSTSACGPASTIASMPTRPTLRQVNARLDGKDHAGLQAAVEGLSSALDHGHAEERQALFEADVALEYAQHGRPLDGTDPSASDSLRRIRRNLREALG